MENFELLKQLSRIVILLQNSSISKLYILFLKRVTEVRSKILIPLETTGGNSFSLEGFEKTLFTIQNFTQGDLHSTGEIHMSFLGAYNSTGGIQLSFLGVYNSTGGFQISFQGVYNSTGGIQISFPGGYNSTGGIQISFQRVNNSTGGIQISS